MQPDDHNQPPLPQPISQPSATQSFSELQNQLPAPQQNNRKTKIIASIVIAGLVVAIAVSVLVFFLLNKTDSSKSATTNTAGGTSTESATPLTLKTYESTRAGFTLLVPEEAQLTGYADDVFKENYTVSGGSRSDVYGNRYITVSKEVYGGDLQLSFEEYKDAMVEFVQGQVAGAEDSEVFDTEAAITYQSNWFVGDYRAHKMVTEESTRNTKKADSKMIDYHTTYLFVYISPSTTYKIEIEGRKDDSAFQSVVDKMIESFSIK